MLSHCCRSGKSPIVGSPRTIASYCCCKATGFAVGCGLAFGVSVACTRACAVAVADMEDCRFNEDCEECVKKGNAKYPVNTKNTNASGKTIFSKKAPRGLFFPPERTCSAPFLTTLGFGVT